MSLDNSKLLVEADNTHIKLLAKGAKLSVYAYVDGRGKSEAWKFLDGLKRENKKEAAKLAALFQYSCDRGRKLVPEQFKHEKDEIYVFKAKQARLYCFF